MAANTTTAPTTHNFVALDKLPKGQGVMSLFKDDVTSQLLGIEPRSGWYEVTDRKTGQRIKRPNSFTAHFADGSLFSWPTHINPQTKRIEMWSAFDQSIDLATCIQQGVTLHIWRDERKFVHLEIAEEQPIAAPTTQAVPAPAPEPDDGSWMFEGWM